MIVVDASVMVSALWPQDTNHTVSRAWLAAQTQSDEPLIAPFLILGEVAGAITRRTGNSELGHSALKELQEVPRLRLVPIDEAIGLLAGKLAADLHLHGAVPPMLRSQIYSTLHLLPGMSNSGSVVVFE